METPKQVQQTAPPSRQFPRRRILLICTVIGTVVLVLLGIFTQGLASTVSLILSALGVLLSVFQLLASPLSESPAPASPRKAPKYIKPNSGSGYAVLRRRIQSNPNFWLFGAMVIFTPASWVSYKVTLTGPHRSIVTYIAVHTIRGQNIYAAVFENLYANIYHVTITDSSRTVDSPVVYQTTVSVQTGALTELHPAKNQ